MQWIAIITLRSTADDTWSKVKAMAEADPRHHSMEHPEKCVLLSSATIETDISIHFHWNQDCPAPHKSALGLWIAKNLKELGLVNHTLWRQEDCGCHQNSKEHSHDPK